MDVEQLSLIEEEIPETPILTTHEFEEELTKFNEFGKNTVIQDFPDSDIDLPVYVNEFWTSKQRAASSLHEISYRACFKPQLPRFFINRLSQFGDIVYDPFMGRGTTLIESALLKRYATGCDINPLSRILVEPRLTPPALTAIFDRLRNLDLDSPTSINDKLLAFYHPVTLLRITNLRQYLLARESEGTIDPIDSWIRMVATNRLTGHSTGFFSVYTLPPNQALSIESQIKINAKRNQVPPERDIISLVIKKSRSLLSNVDSFTLKRIGESARNSCFITGSCDSTPQLKDSTIRLVVTSPPFLDVVDYQKDNWLRCWFNGIDSHSVSIWQLKKKEDWMAAMTRVFCELKRVLIPGGHVAFEVGEVSGGNLLLETLVVPAAIKAGLNPIFVLINDQKFTKTSNCWGVSNSTKGTNTNRIILLRK